MGLLEGIVVYAALNNSGRFIVDTLTWSHFDDFVQVFYQMLNSAFSAPEFHICLIEQLGRLDEVNPGYLITVNPFSG